MLSPWTQSVDLASKLGGYFRLGSVRHYAIIDVVQKLVIHHDRREDGAILTRIIRDGAMNFDPPGIALTNIFED